jgi:hypothetical protein
MERRYTLPGVIEPRVVVREAATTHEFNNRLGACLTDNRDVDPLGNTAITPQLRHDGRRVASVQRDGAIWGTVRRKSHLARQRSKPVVGLIEPYAEHQPGRQVLGDHRTRERPCRRGRCGQPRGEQIPIHTTNLPTIGTSANVRSSA